MCGAASESYKAIAEENKELWRSLDNLLESFRGAVEEVSSASARRAQYSSGFKSVLRSEEDKEKENHHENYTHRERPDPEFHFLVLVHREN